MLVIIKNPVLCWTKGQHGYKQGIKGWKNYRHVEGRNFYNGYGGARMDTDMELRIEGKTESGERLSIDVRHYLVEALGRKVMTDRLYEKLQKCLPEELEVDDVTKKLTDESLEEIRKRYERL